MKRSIIYAVLAFGTMAVSCSKSGLEAPLEPGEPNAESVTVALASASAPAPVEALGSAPGTKSSTEMPEATVDGRLHNLWAIQYDEKGNLVGTPYYTSDVPEGTAAASGSGMDYKYDGLSLKLTSSGAKAHTVYFVGNTANGTLFTLDNDVSTLDKLAAAVHRFGNEYKPNEVSGIVMMGIYTGPVASGTPINGVRLERLAAKVVFRYKNSIPGFEFTSVQMRNVPAAFRFGEAPVESVNSPAVETGSHLDYPAEDISKAVADGDYKKFVWYVPENLSRATVPVLSVGDRTPEKSDGAPAYVEITGIIKESGRCRKATLKILVGDLGAAGTDFSDFNVKRNTIYTVTLDLQGLNIGDNRLTIESFDMSNSAMILPGGADSVIFDIRKCLNNGFTTQADLNALMTASSALTADVLWQDAQNVLTTPDVKLDKVNGLLTVKSSKATVGNAVVALYPNADKKQGEILWSWHVWVTDYQPGKAGVSTRAANTAYPVPGGQVHTYGTEFQKANGLSRTIMDRNLGATKTYSAAPATGDATADQCFGMFYQWGRKDPFPRGDGSTINPNPTTFNCKSIPIYGINGVKLDDDVINSSGTGLKGMFISDIIGANVNALSYATQNPLVFIYTNVEPVDWYTNLGGEMVPNPNQNDALWEDVGPKSAYDPCPTGWRVPPAKTWNDFGFNPYAAPFWYYINGEKQIEEQTPPQKCYATNGRLYETDNVKAWYPNTGYRDRQSSKLASVGDVAYSYSSTVRGFQCVFLWCTSKYLDPDNMNRRAGGRTVRCIQE